MSLKSLAAAWSLAIALACAPAFASAQAKKVAAPAPTVPVTGIAFGDIGSNATPVTADAPLPVVCIIGCSGGGDGGAGVASATAPTRSEGQSYPFSFDLSGNLRVTGGGGGSGGATSIADGSDIALGARADAAWSGTGNGTAIAILKSIRTLMASPLTVTGTFWQATQPVSEADGASVALGARADAAWSGTGSGSLIAVAKSIRAQLAASLPLPTGAATSALQVTANTSLAAIDGDLGAAADASCATDAGSCSLIALQKRTAERLTSILTATDPVPVTFPAPASGFVYRSAASNNSTLVATGSRTLFAIPSIINTTATVYYLRLYNTAAAPVCSSATGEVLSIPVPADASGAGIVPNLGPFGVSFPLGLGFCITGGGAANDNGAAATGVTLTLVFK